jgi:uncharacterized integral membrane protein
MRYHPPPPSEPNGCLQTLVITRMIFQILLLPLVMILGMLIAVMLIFFAFSENPLLGLGGILIIGLLIYLFVKWERIRVDREHPPEF